MKIVDIKAYPTSFRVPKDKQVSLGIGTMTKRDCVMVKVTTEDGIVGWGESHHARSPGSIGHQLWVKHSRSVDTDLIGTGIK